MQETLAVGYWRFSDDRNGNTIPQQQNAMRPRCKVEGVRVVKDFFGPEEGVSAKDMGRDEIDEMLAYCRAENERRRGRGEPVIQAVVVFHHDRFSRAGSWETGKYLLDFGAAGVHRMLTHERWYDFRKKEDRAIFNLEQDFSNEEYLRQHAARVLRGKDEHARAGRSVGGPTNYGFDRLLVDDRGDVVRHIPRGAKLGFKEKGWRVEWAPIPADDPDPERLQERETVAYLYRTFADQHVSFGGLAVWLNKQGVPGPGRHVKRKKGRKTPPTWRYEHVRDILKNPMYCGLRRWGGEALGDFYRLIDGERVACEEKGLPRVVNKEVALIPLRFGGIVDRALWERVREKLDLSGREGRLCRGRGFILSGGLTYCGHCGARLGGVTQRTKKNKGGKVYEYRKLECPTYKRDKGRCLPYTVTEDDLIRALVARLLEDYLDPARLEGLRARLTEKVTARHDQAPEQAGRLAGQLGQLDQDIVRARRYTIQARDDDTFAELNEALRELLEKRRRLQADLDRAERAGAVDAGLAAGKVDAAIDRLHDLGKRLRAAPKPELGELLRRMVSRVDIFWEQDAKKERTWYVFSRGIVKLRPVLEFGGSQVSGCSQASQPPNPAVFILLPADLQAA